MRLNLRAPHLESYIFEIVYWALVGLSVFGIVWSILESHAWIAVISVIVLAAFVYGGFIEPHLITVKRYRVPLVKEPKASVRMVFLSDLHAGSFKGAFFFNRLARRVNRLNPDICVLGGDLVEEHADPIVDLEPLRKVKAPLGRYFLLGNHDYLDHPQLIRETVKKWKFEELTNHTCLIEKDGRSFTLIGLDDTWFGAPTPQIITRTNHPRFLVTHEPDTLLDLEEGDVDAVVVGHTHGGQVRLPLLGSIAPIPEATPQWLDRGLKMWKGIRVILSQGIGESNVRVRFFCPPQIVVIEIGI